MRIIIITDMRQDQTSPDRQAAPQPRTDPVPRVTSRELLGAQGQLVIAHEGREYRLRITQNGKLILTA